MGKLALRRDRAAEREPERLTRLVALGGFLPRLDHRLMTGTRFEPMQYYAKDIQL